MYYVYNNQAKAMFDSASRVYSFHPVAHALVWGIVTAVLFANIVIEYLEMLNAYNCMRWWCSGIPLVSSGVVFLVFLIGAGLSTGFNHIEGMLNIGVPSGVVLLVGGLGLLRWDIDPLDPSVGLDHDRHRTEYYDTHQFALVLYTMVIFWSAVFVVTVTKNGEYRYVR